MSPMQPPAPDRAGIGAPVGLLLAGLLERLGQPVLRVLDLHDADLAELAGAHHLARLPHHRVAGVVVRHGEDEPGLARRSVGELPRLLQRRRQRLVADDVDAGLEEGRGGRRVHVVRRDDRHRLDAVLAGGARAWPSPAKRAVGALGSSPSAAPERMRLLRRGRQRAGHQLVLVVQPRGDAVHRADEGALAAAHHAEPDAPARGAVVPSLDGHVRLSRVAPADVPGGGRSPQFTAQPEHPPDLLLVDARAPAKSSKAFSVDADDVVGDERGALARAVLGVLQAALPFQHRPAVVAVLRPSWRRSRRNRPARRRASGSGRPGSPRAGSRE